MCSKNQSSIPSGKIPFHYDRDKLARDLLEVYVFADETLGDALHSNLSRTKELCQTMQQACLASPTMEQLDITSDDLYGFLGVVINKIKISDIMVDRLSSLEMRFNSETRKHQQIQYALEDANEQIANHKKYILELESQVAETSKDKRGEA